MKLIQWNCQGAFRNKNEKILIENPDIVTISECENPKKLKFGILTPKPSDYFWYGENENKGIGIFSYSDYRFELYKHFDPRFKYILPFIVSKKNKSFTLFAIWTKPSKNNSIAEYIAQVWLSIDYYSELLKGSTVLLGDFNSNSKWDSKQGPWNHSNVVGRLLNNYDIRSLYHDKFYIEHGSEIKPTFFMNRNKNKPYHVDYCFASKNFWNGDYDFHIGDYEDWNSLSDHVPIVITIKKENAI